MTDQSIPPWLREEAEKLDAKIRLAIAAVRCDSSTPTGSFADAIAAFALRVGERLAQEAREGRHIEMWCVDCDVPVFSVIDSHRHTVLGHALVMVPQKLAEGEERPR